MYEDIWLHFRNFQSFLDKIKIKMLTLFPYFTFYVLRISVICLWNDKAWHKNYDTLMNIWQNYIMCGIFTLNLLAFKYKTALSNESTDAICQYSNNFPTCNIYINGLEDRDIWQNCSRANFCFREYVYEWNKEGKLQLH